MEILLVLALLLSMGSILASVFFWIRLSQEKEKDTATQLHLAALTTAFNQESRSTRVPAFVVDGPQPDTGSIFSQDAEFDEEEIQRLDRELQLPGGWY